MQTMEARIIRLCQCTDLCQPAIAPTDSGEPVWHLGNPHQGVPISLEAVSNPREDVLTIGIARSKLLSQLLMKGGLYEGW